MDFCAETEKRKENHLLNIGELAYRRYLASKAVEDSERLIAELDQQIAEHEAALREADQAQRNFNSYLAVKEAALTTDQLAEGIAQGSDTGGAEQPKVKRRRKKDA